MCTWVKITPGMAIGLEIRELLRLSVFWWSESIWSESFALSLVPSRRNANLHVHNVWTKLTIVSEIAIDKSPSYESFYFPWVIHAQAFSTFKSFTSNPHAWINLHSELLRRKEEDYKGGINYSITKSETMRVTPSFSVRPFYLLLDSSSFRSVWTLVPLGKCHGKGFANQCSRNSAFVFGLSLTLGLVFGSFHDSLILEWCSQRDLRVLQNSTVAIRYTTVVVFGWQWDAKVIFLSKS